MGRDGEHDTGPLLMTVGHGTMPADAFSGLLRGADVASVVDVRSVPASRHNPQFARERIQAWLPASGIAYRWERRLGGFRRGGEGSPNVALRHRSFRAYADYMATREFRAALDVLLTESSARTTAVMCAETLWWRCHRRLVADAACLLWGAKVCHLGHDGRSTPHRLTDGVRLTDVLGVRLVMAGAPSITAGLARAAAAAWVVLNYGLPWSIVARAHRPVLREFNGTWFIWVVGTQSLAIVAAALVGAWHGAVLRQHLAEVAVCLWGVGIVLYLVLVVIILLRLMVVEVTPGEMGPAYWIAMGATAISVRAAAGVLALPGRVGSFPLGELRPFIDGTSVVLWAFGSWWIPLLVLFGLWRHVLRHYPLSYEPRLWSMVFPLGMYTVASYSLGRAAGFGFMVSIARVWVFVGVAAWAGVLVLMLFATVQATLLHRDAG